MSSEGGGATVRQFRRLVAIGACTLLGLVVRPCQAAYVFHKIADTSTAVPAGLGAFTAFDDVAYDGQHVAMRARGAGGQEGIYLWDGAGLAAVADLSMQAPDGGGTFDDFGPVSLDGGRVAFLASGSLKDGVYTTLGGGLRRVADTSMLMPGSSTSFSQFMVTGDVAISGQTIAFSAAGGVGPGANAGVYSESGGELVRVADRSTSIPDFDGSFLFFGAVDASGDEIVFAGGQGSFGGNGFYTTAQAAPGAVRTLLNSESSVPGLANPISIFSPNTIGIDGQDLAFSASDDFGGRGIYLERSGTLEVVADKNTADPVSGELFAAFGTAYSLAGGAVAFQASAAGKSGIYLKDEGAIRTVIRASDVLCSKTVSAVTLYGESLAEGRLAFKASFAEGGSGIYVAIPTFEGDGLHTVSLPPVFDAGWLNGEVTDGEHEILVQQQAGVEAGAVMEFDLSVLPSGAKLSSAALRIYVDALTFGEEGGPALDVYGYEADGVLDASDALRRDVTLGATASAIELGWLEIPLEAGSLQQLSSASGVAGVVVAPSAAEHLVSFDAMEKSPATMPQLVVSYTLESADFTGDGIVNADDLVRWQANFGSTSVDGSQGDADGDGDADGVDFLVWQRQVSHQSSFATLAEPAWTGSFVACVFAFVSRGRAFMKRRRDREIN